MYDYLGSEIFGCCNLINGNFMAHFTASWKIGHHFLLQLLTFKLLILLWQPGKLDHEMSRYNNIHHRVELFDKQIDLEIHSSELQQSEWSLSVMLSQVTWERRLFFALSNYYLTPIKKNQTKSKSFKNEKFSVIIKHCVKG